MANKNSKTKRNEKTLSTRVLIFLSESARKYCKKLSVKYFIKCTFLCPFGEKSLEWQSKQMMVNLSRKILIQSGKTFSSLVHLVVLILIAFVRIKFDLWVFCGSSFFVCEKYYGKNVTLLTVRQIFVMNVFILSASIQRSTPSETFSINQSNLFVVGIKQNGKRNELGVKFFCHLFYFTRAHRSQTAVTDKRP